MNRLKLSNYLRLLSIMMLTISASDAATTTSQAIGQGAFRSPSWSHSSTISELNEPYTRVTSVTYRFFTGGAVSQSVTNSSSFNRLFTISGSATFELSRNNVVIDTHTISPRRSNVVLPGRSSNLLGVDSETSIVNLPLNDYAGTYRIRSLAGTGPNLETNGSVQLTYTYEPLGLSSDDAIVAPSKVDGKFIFDDVPTARWLTAPSGQTIRFESTDGIDIRSFRGNVTGDNQTFRVVAGGIDYGLISSGQNVNFNSSVDSVEIYGADGELSAQLGYISSNADIEVSIVPEPSSSSCLLVSFSIMLLRRKRVG